MLARKIVQSQVDQETQLHPNVDELSPLASSSVINVAGGGLKPPTLRINTDDVNKIWDNRPLRERTNVNAALTNSNSNDRDRLTPCMPMSAFTTTPNTSYTFGVPNPTTVLSPPPPLPSSHSFPPPLPSSCLPYNHDDNKRYTLAESALVTSLRYRPPEPSPHELQIRALEHATALLAARAREAQENATRLHARLADRNKVMSTEEKKHEEMQRERWMEERRSKVADEEVKAIEGALQSLTNTNHPVEQVQLSSIVIPDTKAKRRERAAENLAAFFAYSPTRTPVSSGLRRSSIYMDRRRTMHDVTPLRLCARSSIPLRISRPHVRSVSLDLNIKRNSVQSTSSRRERTSVPPVLDIVPEDTDTSNDTKVLSFSPPTTVSECESGLPSLSSAHTQSSSSSASHSSALETPDWEANGFATIYARTPAVRRRSRADILAGVMIDSEEQDTMLPEYALELLDDLDSVDGYSLPPLIFPRNHSLRRSRKDKPVFPLAHPSQPPSHRPSSSPQPRRRSRKRWSLLSNKSSPCLSPSQPDSSWEIPSSLVPIPESSDANSSPIPSPSSRRRSQSHSAADRPSASRPAGTRSSVLLSRPPSGTSLDMRKQRNEIANNSEAVPSRFKRFSRSFLFGRR